MAVDWQADILFRPSSGGADKNTKLPRFQPVLPEQRQYHYRCYNVLEAEECLQRQWVLHLQQ
jgi:hypothetical protein